MAQIGNGNNGRKAQVLEISNRATLQKLNAESLSGLTQRLDNHESSLNTNAHQISNIPGLQDELYNKASLVHRHSVSDVASLSSILSGKADAFSGYTGSVSIIDIIDFENKTFSIKTLTFDNGILVNVS